MSMGFYVSQITVGSFLFSIATIGWLLRLVEKNRLKWMSKVGDCSYGIFYIHMAVLMLIGKFIQSENWYIFWSLRFVLTSMISFGVVLAGQRIFRSKKKILRYIGLI